MENKFVKEEAKSFTSIIELFNSVANEKTADEEDLRELIADIDRSEVLYRMLINISQREDFGEYFGAIVIHEQDKPVVQQAFDWYREQTTNPERTEKVIGVIEHLFGI